MFGLGTTELLVFGIIAVLLFGKRLPEVAKTLGTSYRDFRKGLNDIQRQMDVNHYLEDNSSHSSGPTVSYQPQQPAVPKFELPEGESAPQGELAGDATPPYQAEASDEAERVGGAESSESSQPAS